MKYTRDTTLGDHQIYEVYEGSPEEIAELNYLIDNEVPMVRVKDFEEDNRRLRELILGSSEDEEELIYDQEDAIDFIWSNLFIGSPQSKKDIKLILEAEEDYMKSIGIIE